MTFEWIDDALARGVPQGSIELHVQSVVDLASGLVAGGEAFVRWRDPEHGIVPAGEWIPRAEAQGVLADVCRATVGEWLGLSDGPGRPIVSFNVGPGQLADVDFVDELLAAPTRRSATSAIEIHHADLASLPEDLVTVLGRLRDHGYAIWLDDLGDAPSAPSFDVSALRAVIDVVKLDRALLAVEADRLADITRRARDIGAAALIEGIETDEHHAVTMAAGIGFGQGFRFGFPTPVAEWRRAVAGEVAPREVRTRLSRAADRSG